MNYDESRPHIFLIILLGAGLAIILLVSVVQRIINPSLIQKNSAPISTVSSITKTDNSEMSAIGNLMKKAAENPTDQAVLLKLVENLLAVGQWDAAENFAQKALSMNSTNAPDPKLLYLLALTRHNKGEHHQAAEILEQLLSGNENASARYSLAILYLHYLNKPAEGIAQLKQGLALPNLSPSLTNAMREELEKFQNGDKKASDASSHGPK